MPHPQLGVPTLLDVRLRPAAAEDQESAKSLFCTGEIVRWIHGPQNTVGGYLSVKRSHQSAKSLFANGIIKLIFSHN